MTGKFTRLTTMGLLALLASACFGERPMKLGVKDGALAACPPSPNCVSSQAADEGHRIAPLSFSDAPETAMARLTGILKSRPDVTIIEATDSYLRVELRTTFFVDDAEFLLDRERHVIQVRSASRLGYSDFGKNRQRMEEIRGQWRQ